MACICARVYVLHVKQSHVSSIGRWSCSRAELFSRRTPSGTSAVEFDRPTIALVDDVETNVTVTVDASSSGTSTRFDFVFPNFKSLYYDPTVGFEDESGVESSSSSTGGSSTGGSSINYDGVDDETASTTTASPGIRATPALAPIALVAALNAMLAFLVD